jgi:hypothetical protein
MISPWRKRDNFSVSRHQELVDEINLDSILTATGELQVNPGGGRTIIDSRRAVVEEIFIGSITDTGPNGESDWPDARYFVQRKVPAIPATTTDPITLEDDVNPESEMTSDGSGDAVIDEIVTATHTPELSDATHLLKVDQQVTVIVVYAYKDDKLYKIYLILPVQLAPNLLPVALTQTGGAIGTQTTASSWTYTVKDITNTTTLLTGASPLVGRPNGKLAAAGYGTGYYAPDGSGFVLFKAEEIEGTGGCPTPP